MLSQETVRIAPQLFEPRSIAVIGASDDVNTYGGRALANLRSHESDRRVFPVNPRHSQAQGLPCYASVAEVPGQIDAAVVATPAAGVAQVITECAAQGCRLAAVVSSGFAEAGPQGAKYQRQMLAAAAQAGVRVLGPNCLGFINFTPLSIACATAAIRYRPLRPGPISLVAQSGMLGFVSVLGRGLDRGLGFRYAFSTGNEADLGVGELLLASVEDPQTEVVLALIESIRDIATFSGAAARAAELGKPLAVMKFGVSPAGQAAALTHTGALTGPDHVIDALLRRYGVARVSSLDDLWEFAGAYLSLAGKKALAKNVGIVSSSGGLNGIASDEAWRNGFDVPDLSTATKDRLSSLVASFGQPTNPLDVTGYFAGVGREAVLGDLVTTLASDEAIDAVVFGPGITTDDFRHAAAQIGPGLAQCDKAVFVVSLGGDRDDDRVAPIREAGLWVFHSLPTCFRVLRLLADYQNHHTNVDGLERDLLQRTDRLIAAWADPSRIPLDRDSDDASLLAAYSLPLVEEIRAGGVAECVAAAERLGFPVVLKAAIVGQTHKTEFGAVKLDLRNGEAVRDAACELTDALGDRLAEFIIQPMISGGIELLVGLESDPRAGVVLVAAFGGIYAELVGDKATRHLPVDERTALAMLRQLRLWPLLAGYRGGHRYDTASLVAAMVAISRLGEDHAPELTSLDVNPLVVLPDDRGAVIVDWRTVWRSPEKR